MKKIVVTFLAICFAATSLMAIKTKDAMYNKNYNFNTRIMKEVLPYFNLHNPENYKQNIKRFKGASFAKKQINIAYDIFGPANAKYHIVLLHGFGETYVKYAELMYDLEILTGNSIRFYVLDHRGFGFSERFKISDFGAAHMDKFDNAVKDIKTFMDKVVIPDVIKTTGDKSSIYLFAHSMGGGIAARFLQLHHGYFQKVILNAPMLSIKLFNLPLLDDAAISALSTAYYMAGYGEYYASLSGVVDEQPYNGYKKFEDNNTKCTNSHERYYFGCKTIYGSKKEPGLYLDNTVGGHTWGWLYRASRLTYATFFNIHSTDTESQIRIFQAENDRLVKAIRHNYFGAHLKNCSVIKFKNILKNVQSKHELYMEVDEIRGDGESTPNKDNPITVIDHIFTFFDLDTVTASSKFI